MSITATANIENDLNFTLIQVGSNAQNESAGLGYSASLTNGTGSLQINYGAISSGALPSGGKLYFDMQAFEKSVFGTTASINFSTIKSLVVENRETTFTYDINIHATGGTALTEPWNGGSGNQLIKPYAAWQYSDPMSGVTVDGSNNQFTLQDVSGSGANYTVVVVGITG